MRKSAHYFVVEVDVDYYYTHNMKGEKSSLYIPQEGTKFQRLPKHGILRYSIDDEIKEGTEVYFHHFAIDTLFKLDGKNHVILQPHELYAYKSGEEIIGYSRIVSNRIHTEKWLKNEEAIIKLPDVVPWESHKFEVLHNPTKCPVEKGDIVWIYTNTDYIIEHMQEYSFLDPDKIVYNETKDELFEPWVLAEVYDSKKSFYKDEEIVGGIIVPKAAAKKKNQATIIRGRNGIKAGDEVIIKRSASNILPMFPDYNIVNYKDVLVCIPPKN